MSLSPEEIRIASQYRSEGRSKNDAFAAIQAIRTKQSQPVTTSAQTGGLTSDERNFATRWKNEGQDKSAVLQAIQTKRSNPEGFSWADAWAGVKSAVPTTLRGAQELEAKYNPVRSLYEAVPGRFGERMKERRAASLAEAQQKSGETQMDVEARGLDAEVAQIVGNIGIDAAIFALASAVAGVATATTGVAGALPSAAVFAAMSVAKKAKYAKSLQRIYKYAIRNPKTATWAKRMAQSLPEIAITGVAQDTGQHGNVPLGLGLSTAATGLLSLIGLKNASKLVLLGDDVIEDAARYLGRNEEEVGNILDDLRGLTAKDREAIQSRIQQGVQDAEVPLRPRETEGFGIPVDKHSVVNKLADRSGEGVSSTLKNILGSSVFNKGRVLREMGEGGEGIANRFSKNTLDTNTFINEDTAPLERLRALRSATGLSPEDASSFAEGKLPMAGRNLTEEMTEFRNAHKAYFDDQYQKITATGIELNRRENYLSKVLKSDVLEDILSRKSDNLAKYAEDVRKEMVRRGVRHVPTKDEISFNLEKMAEAYKTNDQRAFFEFNRQHEDIAKYFPDSLFERDYDKLIGVYTEAAAKRRAFVKNFGANKELIMEDLQKVNRDFANKSNKKANPKMAKQIMDQFFTRSEQPGYVRKIRAAQMLKMWASAPTNIADNVQTAMRFGLGNVMRNMVKAAFSPEARRIADLHGAKLEDLSRSKIDLEKVRGWVEKWLRFVGFEATQKWADRTVVLSSLDYAKGLHKQILKNPDNAVLQLRAQRIIGDDMYEEFLRDGVTKSNISRIGAKSLQDMRPISPIDVPYWVDQPGAVSLIFQFKRFTFQQARSVRTEIYEAWQSGDKEHAMKALGTLAFAGVMAGKAAGAGKDAMKDSLLAISNFIMNGKFESPRQEYEADTWLAGIVDDFGQAGGVGLASEVLESISRGTWVKGGLLGAFGGPALSDVMAISEGILDPILKEPERIAEGKTTIGKVANRSVSNLLNPLPFAKMVFDKVVKPTLETGKAPEGRTPIDTIDSAANSVEEVVKASVFLFKQIKRSVGATDAAAISLMAGVHADPKAKFVEIKGDGGEMMRKYIKEGKGEWGIVERVIDGDTIELKDGSTIRFTTVQAPEISHKWYDFWENQPGGQMSKKFVEEAFPEGSKVYSAGDDVAGSKGVHDRDLRTVFDKDGRDIVKESYQKGHSKIFDKYPSERTKEFKQSEVTGRRTAPPKKSDTKPGTVLGSFMDAISTQESGGDYDIQGTKLTSGSFEGERAHGKFQIMPGNWNNWAKEAGLGENAEKTPVNQDKVAAFKMNQYIKGALERSGGNKEAAIKIAAVQWYGNGKGINSGKLTRIEDISTEPSRHGGKTFASPSQYADNIYAMFQRNIKNS